ncbi:MAG: bifunctional folylpolyglutamate synthase/dihydrofolate synthase [Ruminococcaceae bacterium]|nr:bifunctional folylpolyglutamate synthase/dihydrofolate synthase [Oscillospiraceae bacterium]
MTEDQILDWIHSTQLFGSVLGLNSVRELLNRLGNPQKKMKIIHVAGTNGKGSVCSMLASVLTEAGYKTGLYTSPYIEQFRERIRIDGEMISSAELAICGERVKIACEQMQKEGLPHPTEFELVTALGFLYYANQNCDFVVLEVGLGGRLDATNVIDAPLLSVITSIDFDHVDRLGNTLEEIAFEKCGIIKSGTTVVTGANQPDEVLKMIKKRCEEESVVLSVAKEPECICATLQGTEFNWDSHRYRVPLLGNYQAQNSAIVLEAIKQLRNLGISVSDTALKTGLDRVTHIARMELIRPNFMIDGGHNLSGIQAMTSFVRQINFKGRIIVVAGMLQDKDYSACALLLRELADVLIATETDSPRKLAAEVFSECSQADFCEPDLLKAVEFALDKAEKDDFVIACGSFTLVGPIRSNFLEK